MLLYNLNYNFEFKFKFSHYRNSIFLNSHFSLISDFLLLIPEDHHEFWGCELNCSQSTLQCALFIILREAKAATDCQILVRKGAPSPRSTEYVEKNNWLSERMDYNSSIHSERLTEMLYSNANRYRDLEKVNKN